MVAMADDRREREAVVAGRGAPGDRGWLRLAEREAKVVVPSSKITALVSVWVRI